MSDVSGHAVDLEARHSIKAHAEVCDERMKRIEGMYTEVKSAIPRLHERLDKIETLLAAAGNHMDTRVDEIHHRLNNQFVTRREAGVVGTIITMVAGGAAWLFQALGRGG